MGFTVRAGMIVLEDKAPKPQVECVEGELWRGMDGMRRGSIARQVAHEHLLDGPKEALNAPAAPRLPGQGVGQTDV